MKIPRNRAAKAFAMAAMLCSAAWPALAQYGHMLNPGMSFKSPMAALADFNVHRMMQRSAQMKALLARLEKAGSAAPSAAQPESTVTVASAQPLSATDFRPTSPRRVADALVAGHSVARLDTRRRTEACDTLLITAVYVGGLARGAADGGNAAQAESAQAFAREALAALGWRG